MLSLKKISFSYSNSEKKSIDDISIDIQQGEFVGIIGGSGAGKTTLLRIMNGLIPHKYSGDFYGNAYVDGVDTFKTSVSEIAKTVGMVIDDIDSQAVTSVVEDEILFGLESFGIPKNEIGSRVDEALKLVGIEFLRNREIGTLSGGQKQRVAIASIVALKPRVLLLDEPTGELDPAASRTVFDMLRTLKNDFGMTICVVEQKIMLLCEYVNRLIVMDNAKIILDGTPDKILENCDKLERAGVHCPRVSTLSNMLKDKGIYNGKTAVTLSDGIEMVRSLIG